MRSHLLSVVSPSDSYLKSVHAEQILKGNLKAATCSNCHGAHDLLRPDNPQSKVYRTNIPKTCGACHPVPLKNYTQGIHGRAMENGVLHAPVCTSCHGEHDIEAPSQQQSTVSKRAQVRATCTRCHDNERIMSLYGIVTAREASYMDSFHGLFSATGSNVVASCADCHRAHNILPPSDPASSVNKANLPHTCAKCHPNAGPNFAKGPVHIIPTAPGQRIFYLVRLFYIGLLSVLIGGMVLHNTLLMTRRAVTKLELELTDVGTYRRFTGS